MYNVIEFSTGKIIIKNKTYDECIKWLDTYGNILDYTIVLVD